MNAVVNGEVRTVCGLRLETAPPTVRKGQKLRDWQRQLAPLVLQACVRGEDAPIADLAEAVGMESPNFAATALGRAKGGGLRMWKSGSAIKACEQNAAIAIDFLYGELDESKQTEHAAADLGMNEQELLDALRRLPSAN
jgi:hypothetical protein